MLNNSTKLYWLKELLRSAPNVFEHEYIRYYNYEHCSVFTFVNQPRSDLKYFSVNTPTQYYQISVTDEEINTMLSMLKLGWC